MIKILEIPTQTPIDEVENKLSKFEYIDSYPLEYKTEDGYIKVIRYIVNVKQTTKRKSNE